MRFQDAEQPEDLGLYRLKKPSTETQKPNKEGRQLQNPKPRSPRKNILNYRVVFFGFGVEGPGLRNKLRSQGSRSTEGNASYHFRGFGVLGFWSLGR